MRPAEALRADTRVSHTHRHLAVFFPALSGGGAQRRMLTLADAFAARGHTVDVVVVRPEGAFRAELSPLVRLVALDSRWTHLPWVRDRGDRWVQASVPALVRYLRRERPAVLLSTSHANLAALWARSLARVAVRLVISVNIHLSRSTADNHQARLFSGVQLARRFYPWADAIIANAQGVADEVTRVTGVRGERLTTIYNPVVTPELQNKMCSLLAHLWFAPGSPPVVLGVGKLKPQKDFPTLLRAFAQVRKTRPVRLIILGEGQERGRLETLARELGVAEDVALPGFVLNPLPYMARAAVFVLSSAWEGFSNVTAEALACGCPVVSTNCPGGGPAEILDGGVYGPLVPGGDETALATAIVARLDQPRDSDRLRQRASLFAVDRVVDQYLDVMCKGL